MHDIGTENIQEDFTAERSAVKSHINLDAAEDERDLLSFDRINRIYMIL